jgi:hypothetical protein
MPISSAAPTHDAGSRLMTLMDVRSPREHLPKTGPPKALASVHR